MAKPSQSSSHDTKKSWLPEYALGTLDPHIPTLMCKETEPRRGTCLSKTFRQALRIPHLSERPDTFKYKHLLTQRSIRPRERKKDNRFHQDC